MYPVEIAQIKTLSFKKFLNLLKVFGSYTVSNILRKPYVAGYPHVLTIEPTSLCNLKCPQCPTGISSLDRDEGYMDTALYREILDEIGDYLTGIQLFFQGEPFMHKKIYDMIKIARDKNIYTISSTNGHFLSHKNIDMLLDSGLNAIIIGLDGVSQDVYEKYRKNGNYDKVLSGIKELISAKEKQKLNTPGIYLQFIVFKSNEDQIGLVKQLGKDLGVDRVLIKSAQVYPDTPSEDYLPENDRYSRYKKTKEGLVLKNRIPNMCKRVWTTGVFTWDGKMASCCFDKDAAHSFGTWGDKSFMQLWKSKDAYEMRHKILKNRKSIDMCRNCTEGLKEFR